MTRIFHFADAHFEEAKWRRMGADGIDGGWTDVARCFEAVVDAAIESAQTEPTVVFFGGDLARTRKPSPQTYDFVGAQVARLNDAGVPVVATNGNHDLASNSEASALAPLAHLPGFHLFSEPGIAYLYGVNGVHGSHVHRERIENASAAIVVVPWLQRSAAAANLPADTSLDQLLDAMGHAAMAVIRDLAAEPIAAGVPAFLGFHGTVMGGETATGQLAHLFHEPVLSAVDLGNLGLAGVMLGHLHRRQNIGGTHPGATPIVYPSSLERLTFGDERDQKGAVMWTVPESGAAEFEYIDTPARRFVTLTDETAWTADDVAGAIVRCRFAAHETVTDPALIERDLLAAGAHRVTEVVIEREDERVEHAAADLARTDPIEALAAWLEVEHADESAEWRQVVLDHASGLLTLDVGIVTIVETEHDARTELTLTSATA